MISSFHSLNIKRGYVNVYCHHSVLLYICREGEAQAIVAN